MNREKLVEKLRESLPLPSDTEKEFCMLGCDFGYGITLVTFKKQRINGIVVGWEFESIK